LPTHEREFTYTAIVVAANGNSIAVDRRNLKTRAGISLSLSWRAAEWVGVAIASNLK
jgi:hypothetical protein